MSLGTQRRNRIHAQREAAMTSATARAMAERPAATYARMAIYLQERAAREYAVAREMLGVK